MSLSHEDPAIRIKLDCDSDKNQQTIILRQNMDNNTTEKDQCQVEDGRTRGKVEGVCRLKPFFVQLQRDLIGKTRITTLDYNKFSRYVL